MEMLTSLGVTKPSQKFHFKANKVNLHLNFNNKDLVIVVVDYYVLGNHSIRQGDIVQLLLLAT